MKWLGRQEWERLHGTHTGPVFPAFAEHGWKWQPLICRCFGACYLNQNNKTRRGKT